MADNPLFAANLALFEDRFPAAAAAVRAAAPGLPVIRDGDGVVDVDIGGQSLYKMPAAEFARRQVAEYFEAPQQVIFNSLLDPAYYSLSERTKAMRDFLVDALAARGFDDLPEAPVAGVGFLIAIGVGLGLYLDDLIARARARHVIVIEPVPHLLHASLQAVDWSGLLARCAAAGATLDLVVQSDPAAAISAVWNLANRYGMAHLDGAFTYVHYPTETTRDIETAFRDNVRFKTVRGGFFEDELRMVGNTAANLLHNPVHLIEGHRRPAQARRAFVVGAGPSVDGCLETIRRWRDRAIVFSASSALQVLLQNGIRPDYHVEGENAPSSLEKMKLALAKHADQFPNGRFDGIRLVASTTVDPGAPPLFEDAFLFFRDSVSSTGTLGSAHQPVFYAAPNAANTATTLAALLGFQEIYLFGCDCGVKDPASHHSAHSAYMTDGASAQVIARKKYPFTTPGNFGGTVLTNANYDISRHLLTRVIGGYGLRVHNCSDGARVDGAEPLHHKALRLDGPPVDRAAVYAAFRQASTKLAPGAFFESRDVAPFLAGWDRLKPALGSLLTQARDAGDDAPALYDRLAGFHTEAFMLSAGVSSMLYDTLLTFARIGLYVFGRLPAGAARDGLFGAYLDEVERVTMDICDEGRGLFDSIAERAVT